MNRLMGCLPQPDDNSRPVKKGAQSFSSDELKRIRKWCERQIKLRERERQKQKGPTQPD